MAETKKSVSGEAQREIVQRSSNTNVMESTEVSSSGFGRSPDRSTIISKDHNSKLFTKVSRCVKCFRNMHRIFSSIDWNVNERNTKGIGHSRGAIDILVLKTSRYSI